MSSEPQPRILPRQPVRTRDGIELCTDVYLPAGGGPAPTVVARTPYGRALPTLLKMAMRLNRCGLAVVLQDCRGRYRSGGTYDWRREENDTYDTLAWIAQQGWADGTVGLYGMSITAHPNFFIAAAPWPSGVDIRAMVAIMGAIDLHRMFYRGGALVLHWALPWLTMMEPAHMGRNTWQGWPWREIFRHLPLETSLERQGLHVESWTATLASPAAGGMWEALDATPRVAGLAVPTLHLSGWLDFMLGQTLAGYQSMAGGSEGGSNHQKLVIGPWDHHSLFASFGKTEAEAARPDLLELVADWYERWLVPAAEKVGEREDQSKGPSESYVLLYLQQDSSWLTADRYPLPELRIEDWYLASDGDAPGPDGAGRLTRQPATQLGRDVFRYDPDDPVPTTGGALWPFPAAGLRAGEADQTEVEQRPDVLIYTSPALTADLTVVGAAEVELWAATSARDTDFTAKLVDVDPLGVPRIVQDGILRGRFHRSPHQATLLTPHQPYRMVISLPATARRFRRGHRIRLEIASSNFPKYDRNLNTADWPPVSRGMLASQTIFHGAAMASRLRLPVLPSSHAEAASAAPGPRRSTA